jgi:UDP-4-amino-4-deoxy-L-arabinose formyltransferase/UDP-glucuronic acid dehydrogenase (UDP-4-keto-hexauronic acid decarboxylating)
MNIAIIGRTEWLYRAAKLLIERGHTIKLIVTSGESPEYQTGAEDFRLLAEEVDAGFICSAKIHKEQDALKKFMPIDIGISVNYINIIPPEVIDLFPYGILNAHGGDLPRYRGNACQAWAIINGEDKIGLCIHKMVGGELDNGDIIAREYFDIDINTKIGTVYRWMETQIPELFLEAVTKLEQDKHYILEKQSRNPAEILRCYPRRPEDAGIDWNSTNREILRLINASSEPYDGAFCRLDGKKMTIWDAQLFEDNETYCAVPGQVAAIDKTNGCVIVITGAGKLKINEISYENYRGKPDRVIKSHRNRLT